MTYQVHNEDNWEEFHNLMVLLLEHEDEIVMEHGNRILRELVNSDEPALDL